MGVCARRRFALLAALTVCAGCRVTPADPAACGTRAGSRTMLLARQAAGDTVVMSAAYPRRAAFVAVTEPATYLRAWAAGIARKRIALRFLGPEGPIEPDRPTLDVDELEADAARVTGEPLTPAEVRYYLDGGEALAALDAVIDGAECRVDVLMYLWGNDEIGWHVARRLAAKAECGVTVRVLVDGGGNLVQGQPEEAPADEVNAAVCWLARQPGVTLIRGRNPIVHLDHRKLVVADGRVAWLGGRNLVDTAFWRDHDLSYTVAGPLAGTLAASFAESWEQQGGSPRRESSRGVLAGTPASAPLEDSGRGETVRPNALARVVRTRPTERSLAYNLYEAVEKARHHVYAENPYFGDNRLIAQLARARRRGADVRVVLTLESNNSFYDHANRVTANRLLREGVRVYLYPGVTHVKATAVDGVWVYTGTANLDNLSLRRNRELGVAISAGPAIEELEERLFWADFRDEWELTQPLPVTPLDRLYELLMTAVG
jgi:cardiolipin synthase